VNYLTFTAAVLQPDVEYFDVNLANHNEALGSARSLQHDQLTTQRDNLSVESSSTPKADQKGLRNINISSSMAAAG